MLSPHVLGAAEVLNSAKMLSPTHVNAVTTAKSADVTTHMAAAAHVSTT